MAKTLKEALLEQMTALQERGLAPGEIPDDQEDDASFALIEVEADRKSGRPQRSERPRSGDGDGELRHATAARPARSRARPPSPRQSREPREIRRARPTRERRQARAFRDPQEAPYELEGPPPASVRPGPPPPPPARPQPDRRFSDSARPTPRTDLLRRNAERIQREQAAQDEIRELLTQYTAQEPDSAALDQFYERLTVETGALPPLDVVAIALRNAGQADPAEVGNQVRLHYRTSRPRPEPEPVAVG